jgi:D-alanyl-D-alanine carboxypeptidase
MKRRIPTIVAMSIAVSLLSSCASVQPYESNTKYLKSVALSDITLEKFPDITINIDKPIESEMAGKLNELFTQLVKDHTSATRASVALWSPTEGFWSTHYGIQDTEPDSFWWASVGKMATASIILQLAQEEKLSLNSPISTWFPDYPNADFITIDHLLTHTGGVFSFQIDEKLRKIRGPKSVGLLIKTSAKHGADFYPGEKWSYSNTGYVMLGSIAETVSDMSFDQLIEARLAGPLSLPSLAMISAEDNLKTFITAVGDKPPTAGEIASIYGAGAIRANATDMLLFLAHRLTGRASSAQARDLSFQDLYPMFGSTNNYYGRGVMVMLVPDPDKPTIWLGHSGGSPNAKAFVLFDVERQVFLSIVINTQGPAEAIANSLLKALD